MQNNVCCLQARLNLVFSNSFSGSTVVSLVTKYTDVWGKDLEEKWFILVKMTPKHNLHKQLYIRFSQFVIIFQILKIYKNV